MKKAIIVSAITFILAIFIEANLGRSDSWNISGIGIIFAIVVMGGFVLADINKKK